MEAPDLAFRHSIPIFPRAENAVTGLPSGTPNALLFNGISA
ncbi:hypothetical protein ABZ656_38085 [Streptomyces sp. NPDC007095]|jgi:hypothetical protein